MEQTEITVAESLVGEGLLEDMPVYEFRAVEEEAEAVLLADENEDQDEGEEEEDEEEEYEGPELSYLGKTVQEEEAVIVGGHFDRFDREVVGEGFVDYGEDGREVEMLQRSELGEEIPSVAGEEEIYEELEESKVSLPQPERSSVSASRKLLDDVVNNLFDERDGKFEEPTLQEIPQEAVQEETEQLRTESVRKILKPEKIMKESDYAYRMPSLVDLFPRSTVFQKPVDHKFFSCCMHDVTYQHAITMTMADSNVMVLKNERILIRKDHSIALKDKVKILSGGMAGLEPLFTGYVGQGMLTGVAIGDFNHPPRPSTVYKAIKELTLGHTAGVIMIVKNSLDTRLIFGQAMEKARQEGDLIDMVTICDDSRDNVRNNETGRESLTGLLVAFKVAGAMSEAEKTMPDIFFTLNDINMSSISASISQLRVEVGTNFQGKFGTVSNSAKLRTLIETMLDYLISSSRYFSLKVRPLSKVHLVVNSFTKDDVFLKAALSEILRQLFIFDLDVNRIYAGNPGLCITLVKDKKLELSRWLDETTSIRSWPKSPLSQIIPKVTIPRFNFQIPGLPSFGPLFTQDTLRIIPLVIGSFCNEIGESEGSLNYLDPLKKFGSSLLRCVKVIADHNLKGLIDMRTPFNTLKYVAHVIDKSGMGFTVALISILLKAIANDFLKYSRMEDLEHNMWGNALNQGVIAANTYGGIRRNESSMLDVVETVGRRLAELSLDITGSDIMNEMMKAANEGIAMNKPKGRHLTGNKDPASVAAVILFKCIAETRKQLMGPQD